ncbi:hypothetical protein R3P38DRAFT_3234645 [Favolaschia claudopus]|uniref:Uncharacterized protein n=1 Tax=Favolaschia claudopus TaxID=2862362 RepID=A0AAV9ZFW3_9AGAR
MHNTFLPRTTFFALLLASLTSASAILPTRDNIVTFCFTEDECFQASADPAGCVDLPLFSTDFTTASLSAPGTECILSPCVSSRYPLILIPSSLLHKHFPKSILMMLYYSERECDGPGLPAVLFNSAGTVDLNTLGLPTVASFLCTSDADTLNLCFSDVNGKDCFQASTVTDGCSAPPRFSTPFVGISLTSEGTTCDVFEDEDCSGASAIIDQPSDLVELSSLGLTDVKSFSCTNA